MLGSQVYKLILGHNVEKLAFVQVNTWGILTANAVVDEQNDIRMR